MELAAGLAPDVLAAIADLERRVVEADGGRLKLEWGVLRERPTDRVQDLLWWDGDRLVGFLGIYAFGAPTAELTGMVDPDARRRGIATALLDSALPLCRERAYGPILLIAPRDSAAARELAQRRGAALHHSEHALQLTTTPGAAPEDPRITVRPATAADGPTLNALIEIGFGWHPPETTEDAAPAPATDGMLAVEQDGEVIGTLRLNRDGDTAGVYGFMIHPDHQGRGIGRDVLRRVCREAMADGASRVHLEVAVDNDRALGLYTSLGFARITTEDYYALP